MQLYLFNKLLIVLKEALRIVFKRHETLDQFIFNVNIKLICQRNSKLGCYNTASRVFGVATRNFFFAIRECKRM